MERKDLNNNFTQAVLYYADSVVSGRRYPNFDDLCSLAADEKGNVDISAWYVDDISQPDIATLLDYTVVQVQNFYFIQYQVPASLIASQTYVGLSETVLGQVTPTIGTMAVNTTIWKWVVFDGSNWVTM